MGHLSKLSLALAGIICLFAACNKQHTSAESGNIQSAEYKAFHAAHSDKTCSSSVWAEYPVSGEKQYLDSVRMWIDTVLSYNPFSEEGKMPAFKGNRTDAQALVTYYSQQKMKEASANKDEDMFFEDGMLLENHDSIFVSFKNTYLTSLSIMNYCFLGGAHGSTTVYSQTFDNKTGKTYGWNMIKDKNKLLQYITDGLKDYFEVATVQQLKEQLILDSPSIPLPAQAPYFSGDGLILQYQQYEIAPYAAGLPDILIPWDKCKDVLTQEIIDMLQSEITKQ
ncbi:MAG: DUF3298 domain-containing protein [Bacteroidales bacterium]|nr:DUF3298 domain-containing protein [Bacteroidales bacterium]